MHFSFDGNGNPPPYYAGHGDRGRGLFASRDIKKGELVHDGNKSDIQFPSDDDGLAWRRLVFNLPRNKACDVIDWSWTAQTEKYNTAKRAIKFRFALFFIHDNSIKIQYE